MKVARESTGLTRERCTYGLLLADPPWRYGFSRSRSRRIENHYPTMTQAELRAMWPLVDGFAAADCTLLLWCPLPKLPQGLEIIDAWGFGYKTADPWDKRLIGMGYYWRSRHELLLLATRGKPGVPAPADRPSGGMYEKRTRHSRKPVCAYERIERMYPTTSKLELFARPPLRAGWAAWGDEAS